MELRRRGGAHALGALVDPVRILGVRPPLLAESNKYILYKLIIRLNKAK